MIVLTFPMVSLPRSSRSANSKGSRLAIAPPLATTGGLLGPGLYLHETVADDAVGLNRGDRVGANELAEVFTNTHSDLEPPRWRWRNPDRGHLTRIHPTHSHDSAGLQA